MVRMAQGPILRRIEGLDHRDEAVALLRQHRILVA
jgi:hypothetical protein